jgi:hypothetical protein
MLGFEGASAPSDPRRGASPATPCGDCWPRPRTPRSRFTRSRVARTTVVEVCSAANGLRHHEGLIFQSFLKPGAP